MRPPDCPLNARQYEMLETLVKTPSWFVPPNDQHMRTPHDERQIMDRIEEMLSQVNDAKVFRVAGSTAGSVDRFGRQSIFAERGELENAQFTILLYAHVDTVYPDGFPNDWHNPLQLTPAGDKLHGLGAGDMKAGAMAAIEVFREAKLPPGVRLQIALCHDEEMESAGARDLVNWINERGTAPDLTISPEIATLTNVEERDFPKKDVVASRIGHVKSLVKIMVPQAHRFNRGALDAENELYETRGYLKAMFKRDRKAHPFFRKDAEYLDVTESRVPRARGFSNTTSGMLRLSYLNVPGNSVKDVLDWEKRCIDECAKIRNWTRKQGQVLFTPTPHETSYEPYTIDMKTDVAKAVLQGVKHVYGGYKLRGGGSTSDANILNGAFDGAPCFDIGPVGGDAHHRGEWVSAQSVAKNIEFLMHMVERGIEQFLAT
jgi:acetylornithine deacetylase/succinyl-diaminopimelate desuccinylase-like protein